MQPTLHKVCTKGCLKIIRNVSKIWEKLLKILQFPDPTVLGVHKYTYFYKNILCFVLWRKKFLRQLIYNPPPGKYQQNYILHRRKKTKQTSVSFLHGVVCKKFTKKDRHCFIILMQLRYQNKMEAMGWLSDLEPMATSNHHPLPYQENIVLFMSLWCMFTFTQVPFGLRNAPANRISTNDFPVSQHKWSTSAQKTKKTN